MTIAAGAWSWMTPFSLFIHNTNFLVSLTAKKQRGALWLRAADFYSLMTSLIADRSYVSLDPSPQRMTTLSSSIESIVP